MHAYTIFAIFAIFFLRVVQSEELDLSEVVIPYINAECAAQVSYPVIGISGYSLAHNGPRSATLAHVLIARHLTYTFTVNDTSYLVGMHVSGERFYNKIVVTEFDDDQEQEIKMKWLDGVIAADKTNYTQIVADFIESGRLAEECRKYSRDQADILEVF